MLKNLPTTIALLCFTATCLDAATTAGKLKKVVKEYPDGEKKLVYFLNEDDQFEGEYLAFYENGKRKGKASYRNGKLHGAYYSYKPNGTMRVRANYANGRLHGTRTQFTPQGNPFRITNWKAGIMHGLQRELEGGRLVRDEIWVDGKVVIPRSVAIIHQTLAEIGRMPIKTVGQWPADMPESVKGATTSQEAQKWREQAIRVLMGYRYLCHVPWRDIMLDRTYIAHTEAGSQLLMKVGKLTHHPENPGLPEAEYQFARKGPSHSNIHYSMHGDISDIPDTVTGFMDDSDPNNITRVGHRRWCLNPRMLKTGFGSVGNYAMMWSFDRSREEVPDYDWVAFPTRGMMPTEWFKKDYAWSISLNPDKYQKPQKETARARIFPAALNQLTGKITRSNTPLPLNMMTVDHSGMGINNCIIFRPEIESIEPGASYIVEISGIKTAGGEETTIEYLVVFFQLNK